MMKNELVQILNDIFIPLGFKKKGNTFVQNGTELSKLVNLQQSNYGNSYYINFGYIINKLKLTTYLHIFKGLGSLDPEVTKKIRMLLDLDNSLSDEIRIPDLTNLINDIIVEDFQSINNEEDILKELKSRPHLNNIPGVVKDYFGL